MPKDYRTVNLLLPEGLSPDQYHALAQRLVAKLGGRTSARARGAEVKSSGSLVLLSELTGAPPETAAVLNDSTWTLTMPVSANLDTTALTASAQSVAGAEAVQVEIPPDYRAD